MNITIASANGPLIKEFASRHDVLRQLGAIHPTEAEEQIGLAGPNDNLQFLFEWETILKGILAVGGTKLVQLIVDDAYKNKKEILNSIGAVYEKSIHVISSLARETNEQVSLILGIGSKQADTRKRNIGFFINGKSEDEIIDLFLLSSVLLPQIRSFVELIQTQDRQERLDGRIYISWTTNPDCSVAVFACPDGVYVEYTEVIMRKDHHQHTNTKIRSYFIKR